MAKETRVLAPKTTLSPSVRQWLVEFGAIARKYGSRSREARAFVRLHLKDDPAWEDAVAVALIIIEGAPNANEKRRRKRLK